MVELVWLVPALPLAGFLLLVLAGRRLGEPAAGWIGTAAVAGSFVAACVVFAGLMDLDERLHIETLFTWIPVGDFSVDIGLYVDPLSAVMILFITGVSALIHMYSIGYMHGDPDFSKFFIYLNLFVFSMVVLVLGDNLLLTFLGWEGVGTCSYLLISFWFSKPANAAAGKKAFVTNRIGDWGFMVAMFMAFFTFGSLNYSDILPAASGLAQTTATFIAVMLFIGAIGKSAQLPLSVWLPDAMAGPTPVSALIHAATMVTAGVYLMVRINPILEVSASWVPLMIAWVGVITALTAALAALAQSDIKKVLAYSTVEMLGYMFLAVGLGAYWAAIFLMVTHAFFKALLFLSAGSVIHAMGENQDMRVMGGLRKFLPVTFVAYIAGWLSLAGVPPFSGFFAKDEILAYAWQENKLLWAFGLLAAFVTALYIGRQAFMVFWGRPRWPDAQQGQDAAPAVLGTEAEVQTTEEDSAGSVETVVAEEEPPVLVHELPPDFTPRESPAVMTVPLVVLAVLATVGGLMNLPLSSDLSFLKSWLDPVVGANATHLVLSDINIVALLAVSAVVAIVGTLIAAAGWLKHRFNTRRLEPELLANAWHYDSAITSFVGGPGHDAFGATSTFDSDVIDRSVDGIGVGSRRLGQLTRRVQSGYVRRYALAVGVGSVLIMAFMFSRVMG